MEVLRPARLLDFEKMRAKVDGIDKAGVEVVLSITAEGGRATFHLWIKRWVRGGPAVL